MFLVSPPVARLRLSVAVDDSTEAGMGNRVKPRAHTKSHTPVARTKQHTSNRVDQGRTSRTPATISGADKAAPSRTHQAACTES